MYLGPRLLSHKACAQKMCGQSETVAGEMLGICDLRSTEQSLNTKQHIHLIWALPFCYNDIRRHWFDNY